MKLQLTLNTEDPFNYFLENEKGHKYWFNPHSTNGEELNNFLSDCKILEGLNQTEPEPLTNNKGNGNKCEHILVSREYASQPYGTCLHCGETVFD